MCKGHACFMLLLISALIQRQKEKSFSGMLLLLLPAAEAEGKVKALH